MIGTAIPVEDLAAMTRALTDKATDESRHLPWVPATVFGLDASTDAFLHAQVHVDGDPAGQLSLVPVPTGSGVAVGDRVVVKYTRPCGAWCLAPIQRGGHDGG